MNTNREPDDGDRLSQTLREWVVDEPLPPRFREQVWNRIASAEDKPQPSPWARLLVLAGSAFAGPKLAYSYAAVLLAVGILAGSWVAQEKSSRIETELGRRYVQSIDPYSAPHPGP